MFLRRCSTAPVPPPGSLVTLTIPSNAQFNYRHAAVVWSTPQNSVVDLLLLPTDPTAHLSAHPPAAAAASNPAAADDDISLNVLSILPSAPPSPALAQVYALVVLHHANSRLSEDPLLVRRMLHTVAATVDIDALPHAAAHSYLHARAHRVRHAIHIDNDPITNAVINAANTSSNNDPGLDLDLDLAINLHHRNDLAQPAHACKRIKYLEHTLALRQSRPQQTEIEAYGPLIALGPPGTTDYMVRRDLLVAYVTQERVASALKQLRHILTRSLPQLSANGAEHHHNHDPNGAADVDDDSSDVRVDDNDVDDAVERRVLRLAAETTLSIAVRQKKHVRAASEAVLRLDPSNAHALQCLGAALVRRCAVRRGRTLLDRALWEGTLSDVWSKRSSGKGHGRNDDDKDDVDETRLDLGFRFATGTLVTMKSNAERGVVVGLSCSGDGIMEAEVRVAGGSVRIVQANMLRTCTARTLGEVDEYARLVIGHVTALAGRGETGLTGLAVNPDRHCIERSCKLLYRLVRQHGDACVPRILSARGMLLATLYASRKHGLLARNLPLERRRAMVDYNHCEAVVHGIWTLRGWHTVWCGSASRDGSRVLGEVVLRAMLVTALAKQHLVREAVDELEQVFEAYRPNTKDKMCVLGGAIERVVRAAMDGDQAERACEVALRFAPDLTIAELMLGCLRRVRAQRSAPGT